MREFTEQEKQDAEERESLMRRIMKENKLDWQTIYLWIQDKGNVIISESQFNNMEVIDPDGDVY